MQSHTRESPDNLRRVRNMGAREKLALAARILDREGHYRGGLAGQVTSRGEAPSTVLTLGFGIGFDEATANGFIAVDNEMNPVDGDIRPNPGTRFHLHIYARRPDLRAIVHTHAPAVAALSMLRKEMVIAHMDQTPFSGNVAYLQEWPGIPQGDNEGRIISEALGDKNMIVLANHGLLTAGRTVEEATVLAVWLEQAADLHMRASSVDKPVQVQEDLAAKSRDFMVSDKVLELTFDYLARRELRHDPNIIDGAVAMSG